MTATLKQINLVMKAVECVKRLNRDGREEYLRDLATKVRDLGGVERYEFAKTLVEIANAEESMGAFEFYHWLENREHEEQEKARRVQ